MCHYRVNATYGPNGNIVMVRKIPVFAVLSRDLFGKYVADASQTEKQPLLACVPTRGPEIVRHRLNKRDETRYLVSGFFWLESG